MVVSLGVSGLEAKIGKKIAFYQPMEGSGVERIKNCSPSILQFLAFLEKQGHCARYYIYLRDVLEALDHREFDGVGISGTDEEIPDILEGAYRIKERRPDLWVAVGGHAGTGYARGLIEHPAIDAVFEGYADFTFPLFLKHVTTQNAEVYDAKEHYKREDLGEFPYTKVFQSPISREAAETIMRSSFKRTIKEKDGTKTVKVPITNIWLKDSEGNIHYRKPSEGKEHCPSPIQGELDAFVDLPWWGAYAEYTPGLGQSHAETGRWVNWDSTSIHAGRGCSGTCDFCAIPGTPIHPSVDAVVRAVEQLQDTYAHQTPRRKPLLINFTCDSHTQDRDWTFRLYTALKEKGLTATQEFHFQHKVWDMVRKGEVDHELLDLIADVNACQSIGVETLHPDIAQARRKGADGEKYVRFAKEILLESMRKNIPTTVFAITIHPESTLHSVADDYLAWAELASQAYHDTGRVFSMRANVNLIPHIQADSTTSRMNQSRYVLMDTSQEARYRIGDVGCGYYPIKPEQDRFLGLLVPVQFRLTPEMRTLADNLAEPPGLVMDDSPNPRKYTDYIGMVGEIIAALGNSMVDASLQERGERIITLMRPVITDEKGYRRARVEEGEATIYKALHEGSLLESAVGSDGKRRSMELHDILKTIMSDTYPIDPTPYEKTIYEIFSHRRWQSMFGPEDFWTMHRYLCGLTDKIRSYTFDPRKDDNRERLDLARKGLKEHLHADAIMSLTNSYHIGHLRRSLTEYPLIADQAREWIRRGPGDPFMGSFVKVDRNGDIIGHF